MRTSINASDEASTITGVTNFISAQFSIKKANITLITFVLNFPARAANSLNLSLHAYRTWLLIIIIEHSQFLKSNTIEVVFGDGLVNELNEF